MRQAAHFHLALARVATTARALHDQIVRPVACGMDVGVTIGVLIRRRGVSHVCARNCCQIVLSSAVPMRNRSRNMIHVCLVGGICMGSRNIVLEME